MEFVKPERLWLRARPDLTEKWVQERIAEDPAMLGLGDLVLRDKERPQPHAGRLDLLLQDLETDRRFEVEIQLGATDESHIIRTIEYWDIERKRYPQYDHCAVLVAEEITSRFLNVISLFNGAIPLIAIQMGAYNFDGKLALIFTTVLDELTRGEVDEDEEVRQVTDRAYWEERGSKETVAMADRLLEIVKSVDPGVTLKYNKFYIGLARDGQPFNYVIFRPQKGHLRFEPRLKVSEELTKKLDEGGLDLLPYDKRYERYRIRLAPADITSRAGLLTEVVKLARAEAAT